MLVIGMSKGALKCALFIFLVLHFQICNAVAESSHIQEAALDSRWAALLHYNEKPTIDNSSFYLSSLNGFSLKNELIETIKFLKSNEINYCRYPARAQFLSEYRLVDNHSLSHCSDYQEFVRKAPSDSVHLVYTSENLSQPSSAMGHIMLMLQKERGQGVIEHGVSFFTELDSYNPISIIYDTVVKGKTGYFQVSPYAQKALYYRYAEGRNIWEYKLKITENTHALLRKHIWELKFSPPVYYFHKYNCATLTLNLLTIVDTSLQGISRRNVSPLDVVQSAIASRVVENPVVQLAPDWHIKMILESLGSEERRLAISLLYEKPYSFETSVKEKDLFLMQQLLEAIEVSNHRRDDLSLKSFKRFIQSQPGADNLSFYKLDMTDYKNPTAREYDSSFTTFARFSNDDSSFRLKYVPASHLLTDSSTHLFGSNSLVIMSPSIDFDEESGLALNELTLYNFKSLVPYDSITKPISGSFDISFRESDIEEELKINFVGEVGVGYDLGFNSLLYALLGLNAFIAEDFLVSSQVSFGLVFEPNSRFKSILNLKHRSGLTDSYDLYELGFDSSFSIAENSRVLLSLDILKQDDQKDSLIFSLGFRKGF